MSCILDQVHLELAFSASKHVRNNNLHDIDESYCTILRFVLQSMLYDRFRDLVMWSSTLEGSA